MIGILGILIIIGIVTAIFRGIWYGTRKELQNEDLKIKFLEYKFKFMQDFSFENSTKSSDSEISRILNLINKNDITKGKVTSVDSSLPYSEKKPWKVYITISHGTWPFSNREEQIEIFSIYDKALSEDKEYLVFIEDKIILTPQNSDDKLSSNLVQDVLLEDKIEEDSFTEEVSNAFKYLKLDENSTLAEINNNYKLFLKEYDPENQSDDLKSFFKKEIDRVNFSYNLILKYKAKITK